MRRAIAVLGLLAAAGLSVRAAEDDAAAAARKIEGSYTVVEVTRGGKPTEKGKDVDSFVIKDGKITIRPKKSAKDQVAGYKVDPTKKPAELDIMPEGAKAQPIKGIYETKETDTGLQLTIAFPRKDGDPRPKNFKGESEDEVVLKLLRKKEK